MSVAALSRLLEAVAKSIKHATAMSTLLTTELFQARREAALASSKLLLDNSTYELRNAPINSKSLFDGRIKEIAKSIFEAQQQRFLASTSIQSQSHSYKPPSQSKAFKIPKYPAKQTTSRPKPTQSYRSKNIPQSSSSHIKKDNIKRTGNIRQFPSSKPASSSARLWRPALSTACSSARGHSSGRTIGPFCGKKGGNNRQQMGPFYRTKRIQDTIHQNSSFVICSDQNESILLLVSQRRDRKSSQQTGSGKGTEYGNSRLLFPDNPCAKKERKVSFNIRPVFIKRLHRETSIQNGNSQIGKTIDETQRLGCLHRFNRCISTCADTSSIQEVSSLRTRRSSISLFGPTVRNVPKSVNFLETDGRYCSFSAPTGHISFSIPRRLADKKSDSQPSDYSDKDLHSNYSKPRFSAKSQEVRSLSCSEIHLHRYGISDATKFSQGSSGSCTEPNSNNQENNVSKTCIGTNFPFSFGQTQCCSRPCSPGQTALTSSSDVPAVSLETSYSSSRSPDLDKRHDSISLTMVDKPHSIRDRDFYPSSRPRILPLYGCQSLRMGSSFRADNTVLSWSLDRNQSQLHINMLEMMAIRLALKQAKTFIHHSCIMISTDNTTVVSYINKQGGTHSPNLCVEVWKILNWCLEQDIVIRVRHIPGKFNILADRLLRLDKPIKTEWALDQTVANSVFQMLNFPNVDLFVTRFNHRLPLYVSPVQDYKALAIDALSMDWNHLHAYAFPPFILIPAVLEKIRQHQCRIVLIAPCWPQQQWFSELLLLVSAPIRLPLIPRLLTQSKGRFVHQNLPILDLHAWELSNNQSEIRNFHKTLQILSPDQEEHLHKKSTMQNGPSSLIGVIQKRLIRSRPLLQL